MRRDIVHLQEELSRYTRAGERGGTTADHSQLVTFDALRVGTKAMLASASRAREALGKMLAAAQSSDLPAGLVDAAHACLQELGLACELGQEAMESPRVYEGNSDAAHSEILRMRRELKECKDDLVRDEEIFAEKVKEVKRFHRRVRQLERDNAALQQQLLTYEMSMDCAIAVTGPQPQDQLAHCPEKHFLDMEQLDLERKRLEKAKELAEAEKVRAWSVPYASELTLRRLRRRL
jgi:chromosome segregation ATPase